MRFDSAGFLADWNEWSGEVATVLASKKGIESFAVKYWERIGFLREYFLHHSVYPLLNVACRITPQTRQCVHERFMTFLERAWNIAGLSHQDGAHPHSRRNEHHPKKKPAAVQEHSPQHA